MAPTQDPRMGAWGDAEMLPVLKKGVSEGNMLTSILAALLIVQEGRTAPDLIRIVNDF